MVAEKSVLVLTDLDGAATELYQKLVRICVDQ